MRLEIKTAILLMCAALTLSSCNKKNHTPAEDPQPAEVGFTAASQAVWVKADETPTTATFPHNNFGVWGIARQGSLVYNLWGNDGLMKVSKNTATGYYKPEEAAYWLKGYSYNFLAVAPYFEDNNDFTLTPITPSTSSAADVMTFTYDMSSKYTAGDYAFDLLGAAAESDVIPSGYKESQQLKFWHLFSQIEIENIGFASGIDGTVTKILFKAFPSAEYEITYDNSATNKTTTTGVLCSVITKKSDESLADKAEVIFTNPDFTSSTSRPIINIIPQKVEYFELYIDFTINEGTSDAPDLVEYQGFKINLTAQELEEYVYNGKYNWSITIGTKNAISFEVVKVNDWETGDDTNEFPLQ